MQGARLPRLPAQATTLEPGTESGLPMEADVLAQTASRCAVLGRGGLRNVFGTTSGEQYTARETNVKVTVQRPFPLQENLVVEGLVDASAQRRLDDGAIEHRPVDIRQGQLMALYRVDYHTRRDDQRSGVPVSSEYPRV